MIYQLQIFHLYNMFVELLREGQILQVKVWENNHSEEITESKQAGYCRCAHSVYQASRKTHR